MRSSKRWSVRLGAVTAMVCTVGLFLPLASQTASAVALTSTAGAYHPLTPARVTDTRANSGSPNSGKPLGPTGTVTVDMSAAVPATATAVSLSVTVVDGTNNGVLTVYPTNQIPLTPTSVINYVPGVPYCSATPDCTVPNLVISKVNGGKVTVANGSASGTVNVVVDLEGYFDPTNATTTNAGHYNAMAPARIADTRCAATPSPPICAAENLPGPSSPKLAPGGTLDVSPFGVDTSTLGISAVVVQLTATDTTADGFLTAFPGEQTTPPNTSNVNFTRGQTTSTRAIVKLDPTHGDFKVFNPLGSTNVVVDLVGFFTDGTSGSATDGSLYTPIVPTRLTDTRTDAGALGPNTSTTFPVAGMNGIPAQTSTGPSAAVLNVTEASATAPGFLAVTPDTQSPPPTTSDVNFSTNEIRANTDVAELGSPDGTVSLYNSAGTTQVAIDAFGYFTAAPAQRTS